MSAIQKIKKARRGIGAFISSEKGQRFFNFAYSIGAAVVIWGALFKILHLPGGNALLSIGMGTEVLMFVLTAFDRPPREYKWEKVYPALNSKDSDDNEEYTAVGADEEEVGTYASAGISGLSGNVTIVNGNVGGGYAAPAQGGVAAQPAAQPAAAQPAAQGVQAAFTASAPVAPAGNVAEATDQYLEQINAMTDEMRRLHDSTSALNNVSDTLLQSYRAITDNSENITRSSSGYVDQMESLNRNIQGLNTIYEIQLKSVSSQLDAIDRVNRGIKDIRDMYEKSAEQSSRYCEETEKMARYMQQLNQVYEKMIHAMTINMYNPMMGGAQSTAQQQDNNDQQ
jgi:gliding motility-associated protein GldL